MVSWRQTKRFQRKEKGTTAIRCGSFLGECLKFEELYAMKKSGNRHINIGELRGMLRAEERHAQRGGGCREIYALDSQVALGCLVKGTVEFKLAQQ